MVSEEFTVYSKYFIADYAQEISDNYGHSIDKSLELAKVCLFESFPNGYELNEQLLLCIEMDSNVIGYVWHCIDQQEESSFIYDFYIYPNHRNKGYAKQAIKALELNLKTVDVHEIKLRVAYHNKRAFKLYQAVGFTVTGYNMSKKVGG